MRCTASRTRRTVITTLTSIIALQLLAPPRLVAQTASPVVVTSSVTGGPGKWVYSYQLQNQGNTAILLFLLVVTGQVGTIQSPTGWLFVTGIPSPGQTLVEWVSSDSVYDLGPAASLGGFSLTSIDGPGAVQFSTFDETFGEFSGRTVGPVTASVTPEPSTFILLLSPLFLAILLRRRVPQEGGSPKVRGEQALIAGAWHRRRG